MIAASLSDISALVVVVEAVLAIVAAVIGLRTVKVKTLRDGLSTLTVLLEAQTKKSKELEFTIDRQAHQISIQQDQIRMLQELVTSAAKVDALANDIKVHFAEVMGALGKRVTDSALAQKQVAGA